MENNNQIRYLNRPPRIQPDLPTGTVDIPEPPDKKINHDISLVQIMIPLFTIFAYVIMAINGRGRSPLLILPMALSMIGSVFFSLRKANEARIELKRRIDAYNQRLSELRQQLENDQQLQRSYFHYNYPSPDISIDIAQDVERSRSGSRIWERRPNDDDFGVVRIGTGTRESTVIYKLKEKSNNEDPQMIEAEQLAKDSLYVDSVPITIQLRSNIKNGQKKSIYHTVQHTLGIYKIGISTQTQDIHNYIRSLIVHFTNFHSPLDARLYVLGNKQTKKEWNWAIRLPHVGGITSSSGFNLCFDGELVNQNNQSSERMPLFLKELRTELLTRAKRMKDNNSESSGDPTLPHLLVVVDLLYTQSHEKWGDIEVDNIAHNEAISLIMSQGDKIGASVIFLLDTPDRIPVDVCGVIEIERPIENIIFFRYAEVGLNQTKYVGRIDADKVDVQSAINYSNNISRYKSRSSSFAQLVNSIDILELYDVIHIEELPILENWRKSRESNNTTWPRVMIGAKNATENRWIEFSATADGIHGMIAGTTGSGKSELLVTLIVGLAINFDPSIVNFVLVDFKGGAAFEEFRSLPHCVDIVTNLEGNAVERMFVAIKSELDRRSKMIADYKVKHIVDYRKKNYHRHTPPELNLPPQPFPHLFIIIDEFAEMVAEHPEYKTQLDSITRLGRAIGVSLILATQRPSGMITDQMRANIKLKICLRVETNDDSRELLKSSDAAFLPNSIPGRAYIQIGNEPSELVQVARAGGDYHRAKKAQEPLVIWVNRQNKLKKGKDDEGKARPISTEIVSLMSMLAKDKKNNVQHQMKPWPSPLPKYLPLSAPLNMLYQMNTDYLPDSQKKLLDQSINENGTDQYYLNKPLSRWMKGVEYIEKNLLLETSWIESLNNLPDEICKGFNWQLHTWSETESLTINVGLVDHPRQSHQLVLNISLQDGHIVLFGASGYGKTTFLRSVIVSFATLYRPNELYIYIMDFAGRNLKVFDNLPHVGAIVLPDEIERIDRLIRFLANTIEDRKNHLSNALSDNLVSYNKANPKDLLPAVVVVIDNFGEIKENFDHHLPTFATMLREGRSVGIYFITTADLPSQIGGHIFNLFNQRFSLFLLDKSDYAGIVGRGGIVPTETNGRGLMQVKKEISDIPLEMQIALPVPVPSDMIIYHEIAQESGSITTTDFSKDKEINESQTLNLLNSVLSTRLDYLVHLIDWNWKRQSKALPPQILELDKYIYFPEWIETWFNGADRTTVNVPLGVQDSDLDPAWFSLDSNANFAIMGPPLSGRTSLIRTWIMALCYYYDPNQIAIFIIDPQNRLSNYQGRYSFSDLPQVRMVINDDAMFSEFMFTLQFEFHTVFSALVRDQLIKTYNSEKLGFEDLDIIEKDINAIKKNRSMQYFVFFDDYDDINELLKNPKLSTELDTLGKLSRLYANHGLHFILSANEIKRTENKLSKQVLLSRQALSLKTAKAAEIMQVKIPRNLQNIEYPTGRGLWIRGSECELVQTATLEPKNHKQSQAKVLDEMIEKIRLQYPIEDNQMKLLYHFVPLSIRAFMKNTELSQNSTLVNEKLLVTESKNQNPKIDNIEMPNFKKDRGQSYGIQINPTRALLSGNNLMKMPLELLKDLPISYGNYSPEKLKNMSPHEIEKIINTVDGIQIPSELEEKLRQRILNWQKIYRSVSPRIIRTYPEDELKDVIKVRFIDLDINEVKKLPEDIIQSFINSGKIELPMHIDHNLKIQLDTNITSYLDQDILKLLPPSKLREIGVTLKETTDYTIESISTLSLNEIKDLLENQVIILPHKIAINVLQEIKELRKGYQKK